MQKDFDGWNIEKKQAHEGSGRFYHEREVWWCALGVNVGFEQDGSGQRFQRPVLIIKGLSRSTCLVAPLTTSSKKHSLRVLLGVIGEKTAYALLSQIRVVDTRRFTERIEFVEKEAFELVRKTLKGVL